MFCGRCNGSLDGGARVLEGLDLCHACVQGAEPAPHAYVATLRLWSSLNKFLWALAIISAWCSVFWLWFGLGTPQPLLGVLQLLGASAVAVGVATVPSALWMITQRNAYRRWVGESLGIEKLQFRVVDLVIRITVLRRNELADLIPESQQHNYNLPHSEHDKYVRSLAAMLESPKGMILLPMTGDTPRVVRPAEIEKVSLSWRGWGAVMLDFQGLTIFMGYKDIGFFHRAEAHRVLADRFKRMISPRPDRECDSSNTFPDKAPGADGKQ